MTKSIYPDRRWLPRWIFLLIFIANQSLAQNAGPLRVLDSYFSKLSSDAAQCHGIFHDNARTFSVKYDTLGNPSLFQLDIDEFIEQMQAIQVEFSTQIEPVVLVAQNYGPSASFYCSVWTRLTSKSNPSDTLVARTMQSIKLARTPEDDWRIIAITVQNEPMDYPIPKQFWPKELFMPLTKTTEKLVEKSPDQTVFRIEETDQPPTYPGSEAALEQLMNSLDISLTQLPGYAPFEVLIDEQGTASLYNSNSLSSSQKVRADTFARSMLNWNPAVKAARPVKCKITFYIK
ncbi:MAG: hypothetical protein Kow0075_15180 [Salibacteraceae bacterium]